MHWDNLPKVTHNEDAIREYEQEESRRITKLIKRLAWIILPIALAIAWWLSR